MECVIDPAQIPASPGHKRGAQRLVPHKFVNVGTRDQSLRYTAQMSPICPAAANRCTRIIACLRAIHAARSSYFSMCQKTRPISRSLRPVATTSQSLPGILKPNCRPPWSCHGLLQAHGMASREMGAHPSERGLTGAQRLTQGTGRKRIANVQRLARPYHAAVVGARRVSNRVDHCRFSRNGFRMRGRVRSRLLLRRPGSQW
jgi:hypothetical protein